MPSAGTRSPGRTSSRSPGFSAAAGTMHQFAARLEAVRDLGLQRRKIAGDRARLAPHGMVEVAAAQQEEQQHHGGIEIGVLRRGRGLDQRHAEREHHAERDRHVHVELPRARSARNALGRTAGRHRPRPAARSAPKASGRSRASPASCRRVAGPHRHRQQHDVHARRSPRPRGTSSASARGALRRSRRAPARTDGRGSRCRSSARDHIAGRRARRRASRPPAAGW